MRKFLLHGFVFGWVLGGGIAHGADCVDRAQVAAILAADPPQAVLYDFTGAEAMAFVQRTGGPDFGGDVEIVIAAGPTPESSFLTVLVDGCVIHAQWISKNFLDRGLQRTSI